MNDTDSYEDVEIWVTNKPTENVSEDVNSNDASVCDDDVESLSSESELKLLEGAEMEVPVETDVGEVHANVGSDEVLQPEQDEDIQDPGDMEEITESREEMSVLEEQPDVHPQRIRRPCDRLMYYEWGSSLASINQINCNRIPQTMGVPPYQVLYVPVADPILSYNLPRYHPYLCNPNTCRYQRQSCYYYRC